MFQQHHEQSLSEAWTRFKDLLQKVPHHGIDLWLQVKKNYEHVNPVTRETIDQSASGKLRDLNAKEYWALLEDLALYDNESWNDPRDFTKPNKAIVVPQDVPSTSDRRLIEIENLVQCLMEAYLAPKQPTQVNKITTSCEICSGPHNSQYCIENPEQAFVEYASSRTDEAGGKWYTFKPKQNNVGDTYNPSWKSHPNLSSINTITIHLKQQSDPHDRTEGNKEEERDSSENHPDSPTPPDPSVSFITEKVLKFNSLFETLGLVPPSPNAELVCTKEGDVTNEEDKRRGVEYVMSRILGFYEECLKLGPEYVTGMDDEGEVTHITAKIAGKPVSISEASIRTNLLFDDADGIDSLPN
ncbi:hypothetical protein Tco_0526614 [Tanacetum coccineum]